jgi:hypothetical protein
MKSFDGETPRDFADSAGSNKDWNDQYIKDELQILHKESRRLEREEQFVSLQAANELLQADYNLLEQRLVATQAENESARTSVIAAANGIIAALQQE